MQIVAGNQLGPCVQRIDHRADAGGVHRDLVGMDEQLDVAAAQTAEPVGEGLALGGRGQLHAEAAAAHAGADAQILIVLAEAHVQPGRLGAHQIQRQIALVQRAHVEAQPDAVAALGAEGHARLRREPNAVGHGDVLGFGHLSHGLHIAPVQPGGLHLLAHVPAADIRKNALSEHARGGRRLNVQLQNGPGNGRGLLVRDEGGLPLRWRGEAALEAPAQLAGDVGNFAVLILGDGPHKGLCIAAQSDLAVQPQLIAQAGLLFARHRRVHAGIPALNAQLVFALAQQRRHVRGLHGLGEGKVRMLSGLHALAVQEGDQLALHAQAQLGPLPGAGGKALAGFHIAVRRVRRVQPDPLRLPGKHFHFAHSPLFSICPPQRRYSRGGIPKVDKNWRLKPDTSS